LFKKIETKMEKDSKLKRKTKNLPTKTWYNTPKMRLDHAAV